MKFLRAILILAALIGLWILWVELTQQPEPEQTTEVAAQYPTPTPTSASQLPFPEHQQEGEPTPPPARQPFRQAAERDYYRELLAAAQKTGVQIVAYQQQGNKATVVCQAPSHINLNNFLDEITNRGLLRDIDMDNSKTRRWHDQQLRTHMQVTYNITFP